MELLAITEFAVTLPAIIPPERDNLVLTTSNTYYLEDDITDKMDTNEVRKKYKYRKGKEVYEVSIDKLKKLADGCDKLTKKFHKIMDGNNNVLLVIEKE